MGFTCHVGSHVVPSTWRLWTHPTLTLLDRPVLDLPTLEGWKAELTGYIPRWFTRAQTVTHPSTIHPPETYDVLDWIRCFIWSSFSHVTVHTAVICGVATKLLTLIFLIDAFLFKHLNISIL